MDISVNKHRHFHKDYGQSWEIAAYLQNGPKTSIQIAEHHLSYLRFLGLYAIQLRVHGQSFERLHQTVLEALEMLIKAGWVTQNGETYTLTQKGYEESRIIVNEMRHTKKLISKASDPRTVSWVSIACHILLAALKLTAALLSGSLALLNDGLDTMMDGFSSLLVYFGLRLNKERFVNWILVLFMLGSSVFTGYEAVKRIFNPVTTEINWLTFAVTGISILVCLILGFYQRLIGLKKGLMVLLTQSIDSRNHVLVGIGVLIGLFGSLLGFPQIDIVLGVLITGLIIKSTIELFISSLKESGDGGFNYQDYRIAFLGGYEKFQCNQLSEWMLYMIGQKGIHSWKDLKEKAEEALDLSDNNMLQELGLAKSKECLEKIDKALSNAEQREWLRKTDDSLSLTAAGQKYLESRMSAFHSSLY